MAAILYFKKMILRNVYDVTSHAQNYLYYRKDRLTLSQEGVLLQPPSPFRIFPCAVFTFFAKVAIRSISMPTVKVSWGERGGGVATTAPS